MPNQILTLETFRIFVGSSAFGSRSDRRFDEFEAISLAIQTQYTEIWSVNNATERARHSGIFARCLLLAFLALHTAAEPAVLEAVKI